MRGVIFSLGRMPPCAGLAPCESLISIILTCSRVAFSLNVSGQKLPSSARAPKYPVPRLSLGCEFQVSVVGGGMEGTRLPRLPIDLLPDDISARLLVKGRDTSFARVVVEPASLGRAIESEDRVVAQTAVAHRRDVEDGRRVRLGAVRPADDDARVLHLGVHREQRVRNELVSLGINVLSRAERHRVRHRLCAGVRRRAVHAVEGLAFRVALDKVLVQLWAQRLKDLCEVCVRACVCACVCVCVCVCV